MDEQANNESLEPEFLDTGDLPAFSAEQGLSQCISALASAEELLLKCAANHADYTQLAESLKNLRQDILTTYDQVFREEAKQGVTPDAEPKLIKFYKHTKAKLDALTREAFWQSGGVLKGIQHNLVMILEDFTKAINAEDPTHIAQQQSDESEELGEEYTKVYVSLYCVSGQLHDWEKILSNIDKQVISRPILVKEEHIQSLIRSKENSNNQAYAVLQVLESNVIRQTTADRPDHDTLGHEMVSLKDSRIDSESILYFVHQNQTYRLEHGLLVEK